MSDFDSNTSELAETDELLVAYLDGELDAQQRQDVEERLPRGVGMQMVFDQSTYTTERLDELMGNLLMGGVAVIFVIWGG